MNANRDEPRREAHDRDLELDSDRYRQAGLLVALLLRYPEIANVRVLPARPAMTLSFLMSESPEHDIVDLFRTHVVQALRLLSRIEGDESERSLEMSVGRRGPLAVLEVTRDLESLVADEFSILLGMVGEAFGNLLIVEGDDEWTGPHGAEDDVSISQGLDQAKSMQLGDELIGFRHDGRVLVFSAA